jgi:Na+/H+ antiporter NhaD/arsenite permease-like protein
LVQTPSCILVDEDLTGILQSAAFWVSNRGGTSGRRLFLYFYLMTTGLSAILGNDPVILSGTAFLVYFTKVAEVSPLAWLFSEFTSCNTASMLLFVGTSNPKISQTDSGKGIRRMLFFVRDLK